MNLNEIFPWNVNNLKLKAISHEIFDVLSEKLHEISRAISGYDSLV